MKKTFKQRIVSTAVVLVMLVLQGVVMAAGQIKVYVNENQVEFDVQPQLIGGRTMVPLRAIFESLGAVVEWDAQTQTITAYNEAYIVKAAINSNAMTVNNEIKTIDVAPMIINGRTLVPVRFVAEAFNCKVDWSPTDLTVRITTSPLDYSEMEKETESAPNYSNSNTYYPGTDVPTYTSVTGIPLKDMYIGDGGGIIYKYTYTNTDDILSYWTYLMDSGWEVYDSEEEGDILGMDFKKNFKVMGAHVVVSRYEVWIAVVV